MARICYSSQAVADLKHVADFLAESGLNPAETLDLIDEAIGILARHPLIGRQAGHGMRELVISHGRTGYVALYSREPQHDAILVRSIGHQGEAGYR